MQNDFSGSGTEKLVGFPNRVWGVRPSSATVVFDTVTIRDRVECVVCIP